MVKVAATRHGAFELSEFGVRVLVCNPSVFELIQAGEDGIGASEQLFTELGYEVVDLSAEKCGFDQIAAHPAGFSKHVEGKAPSVSTSSVGLTRNEILTAESDRLWRRVVITVEAQ